MKTILKSILIGFICLLTGFLLGGGGFYYYYKNKPSKEIILRDTICTERLVEKTKYVQILRVDTIRDTITVAGKDTIIGFEIPIQKYAYNDTIKTDSTTAIIGIDFSGYNAKLDEVRLDYTYKQKEPLKSKKKPVFGQSIAVGIQAGYGVGMQPFRAEPYIGVGVTYGFGITW